MICPVCGSSHLYRIRVGRAAEREIYRCPNCEHSFDREEVKDFNNDREESE